MSNLPPDARRQYNAEGWIVARDCIPASRIEALLTDMDRVLQAQPASAGAEHVRPSLLDTVNARLIALHRHDVTRYVAVLRLFNRCKSTYELFLDETVAGSCRELGVALPIMHTLPIFHIMSHRLTIEGGYHGFEGHQDWTGLQTSLNTVVVWVPLHDIGPDQFPLEVVPRSHRQGLWPGSLGGNEYILDEAYLAEARFEGLSVRAGDAVFMSPFTVHRSGSSTGHGLRLAVSWRYEDALEETFITRGYPFAQTRTVSHDLIVPGFPSAEELRPILE